MHSLHAYDNNAYPVIPVEPAVPADSASLFWPPSSQLLPIQPHYVQPAPQELQDKHYYRKHGANAYYGQK